MLAFLRFRELHYFLPVLKPKELRYVGWLSNLESGNTVKES
jgi:hypothetical protein